MFGIGLAAYWPQFAGLKQRLEGYQRCVEANIAAGGAQVLSAGVGRHAARRPGSRGALRAGRPGNTNSRLRLGLPRAEFVNRWCTEGPTHHCALGLGHNLGRFNKLSSLLKVPLVAIG